MINLQQLKKYVIVPVLEDLNMLSDDAVDLIIGTACQESRGGHFIKQMGNAPACGIYQIEPATARDIIENYLKFRPTLYGKVFRYYNDKVSLEENLICNLQFQTAMCRVHYYRVPERIPATLDGKANYWKKYYNTSLGKGKPEEFIENYNDLY